MIFCSKKVLGLLGVLSVLNLEVWGQCPLSAYDSIDNDCSILSDRHESMGADVSIASSDSWPYLVSIQIEREMGDLEGECFEHVCGGMLIDKDKVITVASCINQFYNTKDGKLTQSLYVSLSPQCRHQSGRFGRIEVNSVQFHPQWNSEPGAFDAAILTLALPFKNSVPLTVSNESLVELKEGVQLQFSGYGYTSLEEKKLYSVELLREAPVKYVEETTCKILLGFYGGGANLAQLLDYSSMGCAYNPRADSCGGDYGGPLVVKGEDPMDDILVGLLSWGPALQCRSAEDSQAPLVFTDVASLLPWITENINDEQIEDCSTESSDCAKTVITKSIKPVNNDCVDFVANASEMNDTYTRYPYLVPLFVQIDEQDTSCLQYLCDGTLVANNAVLTSANCVIEFLDDEEDVDYGNRTASTLQVVSFGSTGQPTFYGIESVFAHPSFDEQDGQDSIAIVLLEEAVTDAKVLNYQDAVYFDVWEKVDFRVVGLSTTQNYPSVSEIGLESITESNCLMLMDLYFGNSNLVQGLNYDSQICGLNVSENLCTGNQGSPAVYTSGEEQVLVGLASWGPGLECFNSGAESSPIVFIRTVHYIDWITSTIASQNPSETVAVASPRRFFPLQSPEQGVHAPCSSKRRRNLLGIIDRDERTSVPSTFCYPYSAIGIIGNCTGAMISPLHVVTAGHCILNLEDGSALYPPNQLRFVSGANGFQKVAESKVTQYGVPQELLARIDLTYNIAVVTLKTPIGLETGWLGIIPQSFTSSGIQVNMVGYPKDLGDSLPYKDDCIMGIETGTRNATRHSCDTSKGMGGAPLFVVNSQRKSDAFIVAIHTLFDKDPGQNHAALMTQDLIQFIQDYVDQDV